MSLPVGQAELVSDGRWLVRPGTRARIPVDPSMEHRLKISGPNLEECKFVGGYVENWSKGACFVELAR